MVSKRAFCKEVREAILDEGKATKDYPRTAAKGRASGLSRAKASVVANISKDEARHRKLLRGIYQGYCK